MTERLWSVIPPFGFGVMTDSGPSKGPFLLDDESLIDLTFTLFRDGPPQELSDEVSERGAYAVLECLLDNGYEIERVVEPPESITCPLCGRTSWHPKDVQYGYCGACNDYTSPPQPGENPPPLDRRWEG